MWATHGGNTMSGLPVVGGAMRGLLDDRLKEILVLPDVALTCRFCFDGINHGSEPHERILKWRGKYVRITWRPDA